MPNLMPDCDQVAVFRANPAHGEVSRVRSDDGRVVRTIVENRPHLEVSYFLVGSGTTLADLRSRVISGVKVLNLASGMLLVRRTQSGAEIERFLQP